MSEQPIHKPMRRTKEQLAVDQDVKFTICVKRELYHTLKIYCGSNMRTARDVVESALQFYLPKSSH